MSMTTTSDSGRLGPVVGRANTAIFITTAVLGFLVWFAVSSGTWLTLFVLDNLLKLPAALRFPLSIAGVAVTVWSFWQHVIVSLRRHMTNEQVALMLEKKYGISENVIINTIQFEEMDYGERQKDFVQETVKAGSVGWRNIPLRELWQFGRVSVWGVVFTVLLALFIFYVLAMPRYADNALYRYMHSLSDVPPVGACTLAITPDRDIMISEHDTLQISLAVGLDAKGAKLAAYPELRFKEGEGAVGDARSDGATATMEPVVGKENVYRYTFENVRHSFAFRAFAGDTYTRSIQVRVSPAPKIEAARFFITPPAYVVEAAREEVGPPQSVRCLAHSKLGIEVKLDRTAEKLQWQWPQGKVAFENTNGLLWRANVEVGDSAGAYDVDVKSKGMDRPARIASGSVLLMTDRKPDVRFVDTAMSRSVMPGDRLALRVEASDDYGLGELQVTARAAYGESVTEKVREWKFGEAPGQKGKIDKSFELVIDASKFVPGRQYFLEARAKDYCPDTHWGVSEPILLSVKMVDELKTADADLAKLYDALERAIRLQKEALDGTRNLMSNVDSVWLDMNHAPRVPAEIQKMLDKYRATILGKQTGVQAALLEGVKFAPETEKRMATRLKEIAGAEAVEANDRAFSAACSSSSAGEIKPAVAKVFATDGKTRSAGFDSVKGRYVGLVVIAPQGWRDETWIGNLSLLGEGGKILDKSGWKVVSATPGEKPEAAFGDAGWRAVGRAPYFLVVDLGSESAITGITCTDRDGLQAPKDFRLYVATANPPNIVIATPDKARVLVDLEPLRLVQEAIYNQLLALKGREIIEIAQKEDKEVKKALGEEGEQAPSVDGKLNDYIDKLRSWTRDHEDNVKQRKAIADKPPENMSDQDPQKLAELNLRKLDQARQLKDWVDDLENSKIMDFADKSQVKLTDVIEKSKTLAELAKAAAEKARLPGEWTWNMDNLMTQLAKKITSQGPQDSGSADEPGKTEAAEDKGQTPKIPELPTDMSMVIPDLKNLLDEVKPKFEQAGMAMMDTTDPSGPAMTDKYSSMAAAGKVGDQPPDPNKKAVGRSKPGRAGQADGEMVADKAQPMKDSPPKMPNRMSSTPSKGGAEDNGAVPATSIGLGKASGTPSEYAKSGKLPPEELRKMMDMEGKMENIAQNIRLLILNLDRYHLPTTDLQKALANLEQLNEAMRGGQGVGIRKIFDAAVQNVNNAGVSVASAMEVRRKEQAELRKRREVDSGGRAESIPEGYEDIIKSYFQRLAEEATSLK